MRADRRREWTWLPTGWDSEMSDETSKPLRLPPEVTRVASTRLAH